jgi:SAM-dependent methyltransferase
VGETSKARERRTREGWFLKYIVCPGVDVGGGADALGLGLDVYDMNFGDGRDATFMADIPDDNYNTVYASHVLEHLDAPKIALQNWFRVLKPGGHLIVCVPHKGLYEKKDSPPSRWNPEHKTFWIASGECEWPTMGLVDTVKQAIPEANVVSLRIINDGYDHSLPDDVHPVGEYSIEIIVKK